MISTMSVILRSRSCRSTSSPLLLAFERMLTTMNPQVPDTPSVQQIASFRSDGFLQVQQVFAPPFCDAVNARVDALFNGHYETGNYPDEIHYRPALTKPDVTRELCNAWKADRTVASLVLHERLAKFASLLMGWEGTRIAQDSVWLKPGKSAAGGESGKEISFHTDGQYIRWPTIACWVALCDVHANNGTLEYVAGSHKWRDAQGKSSEISLSDFHAPAQDFRSGLVKAAAAAGQTVGAIEKATVKVNLPKGSVVFHHGDTWHGSGQNTTEDFRRSIGVHLIPSYSTFPLDSNPGYIYGRYRAAKLGDHMDEAFFPIVWTSNNGRSGHLSDYVKFS